MGKSENCNILLIDDDPLIVRLLAIILAEFSPLRFATSGKEALSLAKKSVPHLVLLDLEMPDLNGFEVCKAFKADPALRDVPIIFSTSHQSVELAALGLKLGAVDIITKPLHAAVVLARVRAQLATNRLAVPPSNPQHPLADAERRRQLQAALGIAVLEHSDDAIIATSLDGTVINWNAGAERLFGYAAWEMVGCPIARLVPENLPLEEAELMAMTAHGQHIPHFATRRVTKGGLTIEISVTLCPLRDDTGEIVAVSTIARGVSASMRAGRLLGEHAEADDQERPLKLAIAQAERANAAKSEFLAHMTHEIRTPLNAVIGLGYLLEQTPLSDEQRAYLAKINVAGRSLLSVVNNVLDLSKIEAGEMILEQTDFDLLQLVEEIGQMLTPQAQAKGIRLLVQPAADLPRFVVGDATRLAQILTNLLTNAIKFTPSGHVELELRCVEPAVTGIRLRCSVSDTGIGIPTQAVGRLFMPFAQADTSTTRRFGGTGLGLSIARRFVELMGGQIGVTSTVGVGSEFWLEIPLRVVHETDAHFGATGRRGLRIMIVGADTGSESLSSIVRQLGWLPFLVDHGEDAIARLRNAPPESWPDMIVIQDQHREVDVTPMELRLMTEFAGFELPPVIVIADQPRTDPEREARRRMAGALLGRPVSCSTLFDAVHGALAKRAGSPDGVLQATHVDQVGARWLEGARILVVDDSEINCEVAQHILRRQGATVTTSCNGAEALERLGKDPDACDVVLMDVQMPEMDGNEATRRIRNELNLKTLPIIALTAGALLGERERALAAGMSDFLAKPLDPSSLIRLVRRFVELKRGASLPLSITVKDPHQGVGAMTFCNIDSAVARQVFGDDTALFTSLVTRLLRDFSEFALPVALELRDVTARKNLHGRLHKLRGSAGVVGAKTIQRLAEAAERALLDGRTPTAIEAILRQLAAAFTALGEELRPMLEASAAKTAASIRESGAPLPPQERIIQRLLEMLDNHDLAALGQFGVVAHSLSSTLDGRRFADLQVAMNDLDFSVAANLLRGASAMPIAAVPRSGE